MVYGFPFLMVQLRSDPACLQVVSMHNFSYLFLIADTVTLRNSRQKSLAGMTRNQEEVLI